MLMNIMNNFEYVVKSSEEWFYEMTINPIDDKYRFESKYNEFIKIVLSEFDNEIEKFIKDNKDKDDILINFYFRNKKLVRDSIKKFGIRYHNYEMTKEMKNHYYSINKMIKKDFKNLEYYAYLYIFDKYDNIKEYKRRNK